MEDHQPPRAGPRPPPKPRRLAALLFVLGLGLAAAQAAGAAGAAGADDYYDGYDADYDAAAAAAGGYGYDDEDGYYEGQQDAYYVVDLDPAAPSNTIQREYMQCVLPGTAPAPPKDGEWRVVDPGMQVTLNLTCLLVAVPEGMVDGAPSNFQPPAPRGPEARLPLLRVGEEYACEQASAAAASTTTTTTTTTCYGRAAPLLLEAAFSRPNGYWRFGARQLDMQDDLLDLCAYYPDARDYDDCLAAFYDWQDLTDQYTRSPDPRRKPRRFAERRELREEVIYRLYLETPEFAAGELFARFDETRKADLAAMDRAVNGDEGDGGRKRGGRKRQGKVLVDGAGRVVTDVDPESVVLPKSGGGGRGAEEGWEEEEEVEVGDGRNAPPPRMTAAEAAELAAWDEEGADPADAVFFERSLQPLPPGAHKWWPPPPPPPLGAAFGGNVPPPVLGAANGADGEGVGGREPAHGPEEEQILLTKILRDEFATAPPEGGVTAVPRLEDPFEPRYDDDGYWDDGAGGGGYYDDAYAEGGYDEAMVTGVSPTGQIEPIGDEILDEWYYTDVTKMPDNMTAGM